MKTAIDIATSIVAFLTNNKYVKKHLEVFYDWDDEAIYEGTHPYTPEGAEKFRKHCADNNIFYYSAPAETFDPESAIAEAKTLGKSAIYLDNMS